MTQDEPALGPGFAPNRARTPAEQAALEDRIRQLFHSEKYAVLATQGGGQPYASLVAFAAADDLRAVTFATPVTTRKYRLLMECDHVALLVDSRSQGAGNMMAIEAFTATGRACRLESGSEWDRWARLLVSRHPQLDAFVRSPTSALFRIDVLRYLHVSRFQEVSQWLPRQTG
jgi:nitroimidazol reductase NimA-like FMN-containing flavoprotein (pyridoxamine 5'-phosphate oxidase superfamily)